VNNRNENSKTHINSSLKFIYVFFPICRFLRPSVIAVRLGSVLNKTPCSLRLFLISPYREILATATSLPFFQAIICRQTSFLRGLKNAVEQALVSKRGEMKNW
jgi:hypothetical protein